VRKAEKITISLPRDLIEIVERRQKACGDSRSEVIVHLLESALRREQELEEIDRYLRGYRELPETDDEVTVTDRVAAEAASWDPWP
jgi:metal-responsive CopG/Arc/MetJ family transcriptional regulator